MTSASFLVGGLSTKFPCCPTRACRLPACLSATEVVRRRCQTCGQQWQVIVRPAVAIQLGLANTIDWTEVTR